MRACASLGLFFFLRQVIRFRASLFAILGAHGLLLTSKRKNKTSVHVLCTLIVHLLDTLWTLLGHLLHTCCTLGGHVLYTLFTLAGHFEDTSWTLVVHPMYMCWLLFVHVVDTSWTLLQCVSSPVGLNLGNFRKVSKRYTGTTTHTT